MVISIKRRQEIKPFHEKSEKVKITKLIHLKQFSNVNLVAQKIML